VRRNVGALVPAKAASHHALASVGSVAAPTYLTIASRSIAYGDSLSGLWKYGPLSRNDTYRPPDDRHD